MRVIRGPPRATALDALPVAMDKNAKYVTRKMINDVLRARGRDESLYPGEGYFFFGGGEAVHWLSSSVMVKKLSDLTLEQ